MSVDEALQTGRRLTLATPREGPFARPLEEEVAIALSAMDCVLLGCKAVYASSELTSGRRALSLLSEHQVGSTSDLRDRLGADRYEDALWKPNVQAALGFAEELAEKVGRPVISPAPFAAPGWTQQTYLGFWETVIRSRIRAVYFNDGWEYSHGCCFEFAIAAEVGLPMFDRTGHALVVSKGASLIEDAVSDVEARGHAATELRASLARLRPRPTH